VLLVELPLVAVCRMFGLSAGVKRRRSCASIERLRKAQERHGPEYRSRLWADRSGGVLGAGTRRSYQRHAARSNSTTGCSQGWTRSPCPLGAVRAGPLPAIRCQGGPPDCGPPAGDARRVLRILTRCPNKPSAEVPRSNAHAAAARHCRVRIGRCALRGCACPPSRSGSGGPPRSAP
jgi:hypothetical protein